jgi:hypothetical protein
VITGKLDHGYGKVYAYYASRAALGIGYAIAARAAPDIEYRLARKRFKLGKRQIETAAHHASPDIVYPFVESAFLIFVDGVKALCVRVKMISDLLTN